MSIIQLLVKEMEQEMATTRKMLALVLNDQFNWKPHEKSMTLKQLSVHLAEIPGWAEMIIKNEVLDFEAGGYMPTPVDTSRDLKALLEKSYASGITKLRQSTDDILEKRWVMKSGKTILLDLSKYEAIRHAFSQTTHHRAQLGVYLRLLNIAIPGSYGPSADDATF